MGNFLSKCAELKNWIIGAEHEVVRFVTRKDTQNDLTSTEKDLVQTIQGQTSEFKANGWPTANNVANNVGPPISRYLNNISMALGQYLEYSKSKEKDPIKKDAIGTPTPTTNNNGNSTPSINLVVQDTNTKEKLIDVVAEAFSVRAKDFTTQDDYTLLHSVLSHLGQIQSDDFPNEVSSNEVSSNEVSSNEVSSNDVFLIQLIVIFEKLNALKGKVHVSVTAKATMCEDTFAAGESERPISSIESPAIPSMNSPSIPSMKTPSIPSIRSPAILSKEIPTASVQPPQTRTFTTPQVVDAPICPSIGRDGRYSVIKFLIAEIYKREFNGVTITNCVKLLKLMEDHYDLTEIMSGSTTALLSYGEDLPDWNPDVLRGIFRDAIMNIVPNRNANMPPSNALEKGKAIVYVDETTPYLTVFGHAFAVGSSTEKRKLPPENGIPSAGKQNPSRNGDPTRQKKEQLHTPAQANQANQPAQANPANQPNPLINQSNPSPPNANSSPNGQGGSQGRKQPSNQPVAPVQNGNQQAAGEKPNGLTKPQTGNHSPSPGTANLSPRPNSNQLAAAQKTNQPTSTPGEKTVATQWQNKPMSPRQNGNQPASSPNAGQSGDQNPMSGQSRNQATPTPTGTQSTATASCGSVTTTTVVCSTPCASGAGNSGSSQFTTSNAQSAPSIQSSNQPPTQQPAGPPVVSGNSAAIPQPPCQTKGPNSTPQPIGQMKGPNSTSQALGQTKGEWLKPAEKGQLLIRGDAGMAVDPPDPIKPHVTVTVTPFKTLEQDLHNEPATLTVRFTNQLGQSSGTPSQTPTNSAAPQSSRQRAVPGQSLTGQASNPAFPYVQNSVQEKVGQMNQPSMQNATPTVRYPALQPPKPTAPGQNPAAPAQNPTASIQKPAINIVQRQFPPFPASINPPGPTQSAPTPVHAPTASVQTPPSAFSPMQNPSSASIQTPPSAFKPSETPRNVLGGNEGGNPVVQDSASPDIQTQISAAPCIQTPLISPGYSPAVQNAIKEVEQQAFGGWTQQTIDAIATGLRLKETELLTPKYSQAAEVENQLRATMDSVLETKSVDGADGVLEGKPADGEPADKKDSVSSETQQEGLMKINSNGEVVKDSDTLRPAPRFTDSSLGPAPRVILDSSQAREQKKQHGAEETLQNTAPQMRKKLLRTEEGRSKISGHVQVYDSKRNPIDLHPTFQERFQKGLHEFFHDLQHSFQDGTQKPQQSFQHGTRKPQHSFQNMLSFISVFVLVIAIIAYRFCFKRRRNPDKTDTCPEVTGCEEGNYPPEETTNLGRNLNYRYETFSFTNLTLSGPTKFNFQEH